MSKIDKQSKSGESQPVTTVAAALPAVPSRANAPVRIHHHGSDASTVATAAATLRISCFMGIPGFRAYQKKGTGSAYSRCLYPFSNRHSDGRQHGLGFVALQRVQLTLGRLRSAKPRFTQAGRPFAVRGQGADHGGRVTSGGHRPHSVEGGPPVRACLNVALNH